MARDPQLWKRNTCVIPGGILTLYALAGILYVWGYRKSGSCADSYRFLVGGLCYNAYPFLLALLFIGLILVVVGIVVFRSKPVELPGHLHPGTPTHFVLSFLVSLVVIPALVWAVLYYVEASQGLRPFNTPLGGSDFQTKRLFLIVTGVGLCALVPYLGLYFSQARLRRTFLRQVEEVAASEADAPFPGEPTGLLADPSAPPPEEFVDESLWPASRGDEPKPSPLEAPSESTTPKAAPAAGQAGQAWAPPPGAPRVASPSGALPVSIPAPAAAQAPVVAVSTGCRAMLPNGHECGKAVGPGGRYCLSHACQGVTASGAPCRSAAAEGGTKCPTHAA